MCIVAPQFGHESWFAETKVPHRKQGRAEACDIVLFFSF
jgi:hypothetical protein